MEGADLASVDGVQSPVWSVWMQGTDDLKSQETNEEAAPSVQCVTGQGLPSSQDPLAKRSHPVARGTIDL